MKTPKILIVDDETVHQMAIIDVISQHESQYDVLSAFNGEQALEIARKEIPDLIISDWEMPVMDGIELIKKLKKDKQTADTPVIMCTGIMVSSENLQTALEAGAVDYIRKPIDEIELIARINANLHLAEKYSEIKKLNEVKDKIFSVISHDLRGPMGTLKTFVDVILSNMREYSTQELEEFVVMLSKRSNAIYSALENLLAWANTQRNNIKYHPLKQPLIDTVGMTISLLEATAEKKQITIQNKVPKGIVASFDSNLVATIIRNLINNAIKFTPVGGTVTVEAIKGEKQHTIKVTDTGVGLSPEKADKIFDKSTYITTYGTDNEKGSGLGLKICREFVEIHQGSIWAESKKGEGSQFLFTLPVEATKKHH